MCKRSVLYKLYTRRTEVSSSTQHIHMVSLFELELILYFFFALFCILILLLLSFFACAVFPPNFVPIFHSFLFLCCAHQISQFAIWYFCSSVCIHSNVDLGWNKANYMGWLCNFYKHYHWVENDKKKTKKWK